MSYTLKTDEILEALLSLHHPAGSEFQKRLESLTQEMADELSVRAEIVAGSATFEGVAFAGTACTFRPAFEGQALPECIAGYDSEDEWSE